MFKAITRDNAHLHGDTLESMFELRHEVFIKRLGWDLNGQEGQERDQFDHDDAVYLVLENDRKQVVASARMLPTTAPNLLGDVFPQLALPHKVPVSDSIWEVTRLAVDHRKERLTCANISNVSGALWCSLAEFGLAMNLSHFVSVSDVRLERIMHRIGWSLQRLGKAIDIDGVGVAGELVDVSYETLGKFRRRFGLNGPVLNTATLSNILTSTTKKAA